jgi:hypothetical protein
MPKAEAARAVHDRDGERSLDRANPMIASVFPLGFDNRARWLAQPE